MPFPSSFFICVNKNHYSNEAESWKLTDHVIIPYIQNKRKKLAQSNQDALLIMDVFRGQMTNAVFEKLKKNNIALLLVPANMTHLFQLLSLTINRYFSAWSENSLSGTQMKLCSVWIMERSSRVSKLNSSFLHWNYYILSGWWRRMSTWQPQPADQS